MNIVREHDQQNVNRTLAELSDTNLVSYLEQNTINKDNAVDALYKLLKQKQKPLFELAQIDGIHPLLTYYYVVSVDNVDAIGNGTTKKEAMRSAAYNLLHEISAMRMNDVNSPSEDYHLPDMSIDELYRLCAKSRIIPIYEEISDPAYHEFTITCGVRKYQTFGNGKNKKLAKRSAAKKMLLILKNDEQVGEN